MVKKHAGKIIQMLSPENYIRQKARTLPIYECLVNAEWKEQRMATLSIARNHTNGNITACFYLVDLLCLGIKDTHYVFNISKDEYQELIDKAEMIDSIKISYPLAHNIIYAALDFAEEFGFKPDKDFTSITRFMLEEDTDDIELIEIECGKDGIPLYISGEDDSQQKINSIIKQLEKTAGIGNFNYISEEDADNIVMKNDEDSSLEEFIGMTFEDKKQLFLNLESTNKDLSAEEAERFINVTNLILEGIIDDKLFDEYYDEIWDDFEIDINDEISDEMLGIQPESLIIDEMTRNLIMDIYDEIDEDYQKARKILEKIKKQIPDIPLLYFIDLLILREEDISKYHKKIKKYGIRFPDYPLIKLLFLIEMMSTGEVPIENPNQTFFIQSIFPGRTVLHTIEVMHFAVANLLLLSELNDPTRLEAFICVLEDLEIIDEDLGIIDDFIQLAKIRLVHNHLTR